MWVYRIGKIVKEDETPEAMAERLRTEGAIAVEPSRTPGGAFGYYEADDLDAGTAMFLVEHPEALPGATRVVWFDGRQYVSTDSVIRQHLEEDVPAIIAAATKATKDAKGQARAAAEPSVSFLSPSRRPS